MSKIRILETSAYKRTNQVEDFPLEDQINEIIKEEEKLGFFTKEINSMIYNNGYEDVIIMVSHFEKVKNKN